MIFAHVQTFYFLKPPEQLLLCLQINFTLKLGRKKAGFLKEDKSIYAKQIALFVCKFLLISQRLKSWYCGMELIDYFQFINVTHLFHLFHHE